MREWIGSMIPTGQRGGVGARILMIVATLAVVAAAIFWLLDKGQKDQGVFNRKAMEISEFGLLQALACLKDKPSWTGALQKTDYEGGWYTAAATSRKNLDTSFLDVESVGRIGPVSRKQQCVLRLVVSGNDSIWVRQSIK
jgi:hypothetical protein